MNGVAYTFLPQRREDTKRRVFRSVEKSVRCTFSTLRNTLNCTLFRIQKFENQTLIKYSFVGRADADALHEAGASRQSGA